MGSGKGGVSNSQIQQSELQNQTALVSLASQQGANAQSLFNLTSPGLAASENFYSTLASGDPYKIQQLISPAAQQITEKAAGAKENIIRNAPAGGEKNLALESVDANTGAQIGALASQGYTSAFPALAKLSGQGIGLSQNAAGLAQSGYGQANQGYNNMYSQNVESKGATLGAFGALGQGVGTAAGGFLGGPAFAAMMA